MGLSARPSKLTDLTILPTMVGGSGIIPSLRRCWILGAESRSREGFLALTVARESLVVPRIMHFFFSLILLLLLVLGRGQGAGRGRSAATRAPAPLPLKARRLSPFMVRFNITNDFPILLPTALWGIQEGKADACLEARTALPIELRTAYLRNGVNSPARSRAVGLSGRTIVTTRRKTLTSPGANSRGGPHI